MDVPTLLQIGDQRESGRHLILAAIRGAEKIARIDISKATGVSPATVTSITGELIRAGLIEEIARDPEKADTKRGRPRVELKIRGAARTIAGIKLSDRVATVALVDFEGVLIGQHQAPLARQQFATGDIAPFVARLLDDVTEKSGIGRHKLSGVGVGLPGIVDAPRGFVYWSPSLVDRNVALGPVLAGAVQAPLFIDNDVNLVAKAEQLYGYGRKISDFIVVTIEHGVGMGIVIDNRIYRGTRGRGAEFGHTKVQLDGALCRCGQRGCLEAYVADYALLREAGTLAADPGNAPPDVRLAALCNAAKSGDKTALSIFQRAGRMLAMGLTNVVNIFDPELIILSGQRVQLDYLYADDVIDRVRNAVIQTDAPPPEVRIHKCSDLMWAKGAAAYAMDGVSALAIREICGNAG